MTTLDEIIDNFSLLDEWDDRYRYVIELGRSLAPFPSATVPTRTRCKAQRAVWLATTVRANGQGGPVLTFCGDSDAHIVRGLIAILFATFSGKHAREILSMMPSRCSNGWVREQTDPAALERLPVHGRAHPRRRPRGDITPWRPSNPCRRSPRCSFGGRNFFVGTRNRSPHYFVIYGIDEPPKGTKEAARPRRQPPRGLPFLCGTMGDAVAAPDLFSPTPLLAGPICLARCERAAA